jgi:Flp pilus assembly protein CpaB
MKVVLIGIVLTAITTPPAGAEVCNPAQACELLITLDVAAGNVRAICDLAPFSEDDATVQAFQLFRDRSQATIETAEQLRRHLHDIINGMATEQTHREIERLVVKFTDQTNAMQRAGVFYNHIGGGGRTCTPEEAKAKIAELRRLRAHAVSVAQPRKRDEGGPGATDTHQFTVSLIIAAIDELIPPLEAVADSNGNSFDVDSQVAIIFHEIFYSVTVTAPFIGEPYDKYSGYRDNSASSGEAGRTGDDIAAPGHALVNLGRFSITTDQPNCSGIDVQLHGIAGREQKTEVVALLENNRESVRDRITAAVDSVDIVEFTRAGLGQLHRKILDEMNQVLPRPVFWAVIVGPPSTVHGGRIESIESQSRTVDLVTVLEDVPAGTRVTADMVKLEPWSHHAVPKGAIAKIQDIVRRRARIKLFAGKPVREEELLPVGTEYASSMIPMGFRVVSVNVAPAARPAHLSPSDRVDVMSVSRPDTSRENSQFGERLLLRDIGVFGVNGSNVFLLVKPEEGVRLTFAHELGSLRLVAAD